MHAAGFLAIGSRSRAGFRSAVTADKGAPMGAASLLSAVDELAKSFNGQLLKPNDLDYETARKVHNGLIDKRPVVIARCRGVADVVDAVRLARDEGLGVAVRGGGHNVAGRCTIDGGMMIDLSQMKGVYVDPRARSARAQGERRSIST